MHKIYSFNSLAINYVVYLKYSQLNGWHIFVLLRNSLNIDWFYYESGWVDKSMGILCWIYIQTCNNDADQSCKITNGFAYDQSTVIILFFLPHIVWNASWNGTDTSFDGHSEWKKKNGKQQQICTINISVEFNEILSPLSVLLVPSPLFVRYESFATCRVAKTSFLVSKFKTWKINKCAQKRWKPSRICCTIGSVPKVCDRYELMHYTWTYCYLLSSLFFDTENSSGSVASEENNE